MRAFFLLLLLYIAVHLDELELEVVTKMMVMMAICVCVSEMIMIHVAMRMAQGIFILHASLVGARFGPLVGTVYEVTRPLLCLFLSRAPDGFEPIV